MTISCSCPGALPHGHWRPPDLPYCPATLSRQPLMVFWQSFRMYLFLGVIRHLWLAQVHCPCSQETFCFNISSTLTEMKYLSKYRCVFLLEETMLSERLHSLWFPASGQWTYSGPCRLQNPAPDRWDWQEEMLQFSGIWFPWHKLPAKGIICSSTQAFPGLHRLRQPCCTLFKIGLNFQRASFFFSSSETSIWNFDGLPHIEESALTHWIGYNWDPHLCRPVHPDPRVS